MAERAKGPIAKIHNGVDPVVDFGEVPPLAERAKGPIAKIHNGVDSEQGARIMHPNGADLSRPQKHPSLGVFFYYRGRERKTRAMLSFFRTSDGRKVALHGMKLILENGKTFQGESFGAPVSVSGEVVFNTGMVGYVESLSDPSYTGQILVLTYPLIGNYGVPGRRFFESTKIHASGLVVANYSEEYSHHAAKESLGAWLKRERVPAITGVDTRAITKILREKGVMLGALAEGGRTPKLKDPNEENLVARVSITSKKTYLPAQAGGKGHPRIILVDCGAKENIVRSLVSRGASVLRVPWDYDFNRERADGIVLSNGPGDPVMCAETIANLKKAYEKGKPILGICLGIQLMALAAGASTYKLKYGHRSHNQPTVDTIGGAFGKSGRCYITSQNHGFAVDAATLPKDWKVWFTNANDGSVEGIRHEKNPWIAVQFHPEASPGPTDTAWVFDEFLASVKAHRA